MYIFPTSTTQRVTAQIRLPPSTTLPDLSAVRSAITKKKPFCTCTHPFTDNAGPLFSSLTAARGKTIPSIHSVYLVNILIFFGGAQAIDLASADAQMISNLELWLELSASATEMFWPKPIAKLGRWIARVSRGVLMPSIRGSWTSFAPSSCREIRRGKLDRRYTN